MIEATNLSKIYNEVTVLNLPNLKINKGQSFGLVGNNGAGKTTFFRLILDLIRANDGTVLSYGIDTKQSEHWKDYTGSYLDEGFVIDFLTPEEYFTKAEESQKKRRFNDAVFYYDQIIKYHQNNSDDYKALFMKAFLYSEELKQEDKAVEYFNQLLTQFPEGDLNESATFMLKEMSGETKLFEEFEETDKPENQ